MKKSEQIAINAIVENAAEIGFGIWNKNNHGKGKQLHSMNARVYKIGNYYFLVSYETLVAFINGCGECFDVMRMHEFKKVSKHYYCGGYYEDVEYTNYSRSSARQISVFFGEYGRYNSKVYTYRPV